MTRQLEFRVVCGDRQEWRRLTHKLAGQPHQLALPGRSPRTHPNSNRNTQFDAHINLNLHEHIDTYTNANTLKELGTNVSNTSYQAQEHNSLASQLFPASSGHLILGLFPTD